MYALLTHTHTHTNTHTHTHTHSVLVNCDAFLYSMQSLTRSVSSVRDGVMVSVTVELVKVLRYEECLHLLNLIFKRAMRRLNLKQVGRNTYDPSNSVRIPQHKLELWPGYVTAITRKEGAYQQIHSVFGG